VFALAFRTEICCRSVPGNIEAGPCGALLHDGIAYKNVSPIPRCKCLPDGSPT